MNMISTQIEALGEYEPLIEEVCNQAESNKLVDRIWSKDASLWKAEEAHQKIINNSLGWLTVTQFVLDKVQELKAFATEIKDAGFTNVMLLGMGGSSLCPEVFRRSFGKISGYPELLVLDSTDPDTIADLEKQVGDIQKTLFIVASKSGSTVEPLSFYKYFFHRMESIKAERAGENFIAITDPGTLMERIAKEKNFRRIFLNPSDIGGRYSALSLFGMVPAAITGIDIQEMLSHTKQIIDKCGASLLSKENQAARLGCIIGTLALKGRDKLTIISSGKIISLGLWIEQLVAESTGKDGTGIVPIVDEPIGTPEKYSNDRLFVQITTKSDANDELDEKIKAIEKAGHPVIRRFIGDNIDLGAEFFVWEFATAMAGAILKINPFDQPNVQESKDKTVALLRAYSSDGTLPTSKPTVAEGNLSIYTTKDSIKESNSTDFPSTFKQHIDTAKPGDYIAVLSYILETDTHEELLSQLRTSLRDRLHIATTAGYGPRYLHSTGQLHKGGADNGIFIIITDDDQTDLPVPYEPYSFTILKQAQALGDFQALAEHNRRVMLVHLGKDSKSGIKRLIEIIGK
jgi:transaldolase / glucose-6-phosphate isomerase